MDPSIHPATTPLRVAFMGTPQFALPTLQALYDQGHGILAVYCQPPKPVGRGYHIQPSPVQAWAEQHHLNVRTPAVLNRDEEYAFLKSLNLDVIVVVAYGKIIRSNILSLPRFGCINVHASLLPRWRGAAPIQHCILEGDSQTGITFMLMDEGMDTGAILGQKNITLTKQATTTWLQDQLSVMGGKYINETLAHWTKGHLQPSPQSEIGITHAPKINKIDGFLNWNQPSDCLERKVRALNPWPGTWFELMMHEKTERIRVLKAIADPDMNTASFLPGTIIHQKGWIACSSGGFLPTLVQRTGKNPIDFDSFLRGFSLPVGAWLPSFPGA